MHAKPMARTLEMDWLKMIHAIKVVHSGKLPGIKTEACAAGAKKNPEYDSMLKIKLPKNPPTIVMRIGKGDKPNNEPTFSPACLCARMSHQAHGNKTLPAPRIRKKAISSGNRLCEADARAITMKDVQIRTVTKAAVRPMALGENFILSGLCRAL